MNDLIGQNAMLQKKLAVYADLDEEMNVQVSVKHEIQGVKIVRRIDVAKECAMGFVELEAPSCIYKKEKGKIITEIIDKCDMAKYEALGWVDTPARVDEALKKVEDAAKVLVEAEVQKPKDDKASKPKNGKASDKKV